LARGQTQHGSAVSFSGKKAEYLEKGGGRGESGGGFDRAKTPGQRKKRGNNFRHRRGRKNHNQLYEVFKETVHSLKGEGGGGPNCPGHSKRGKKKKKKKKEKKKKKITRPAKRERLAGGKKGGLSTFL